MEINVVDVSDRALLRTEWRLQQLGKTVIESNPNVSNAVAQMVKDVIAAAGSPGSLSVLRIYSHGNKGVFRSPARSGTTRTGKKKITARKRTETLSRFRTSSSSSLF